MALDERSILTEYVFLCGDHAMEWNVAEFRSPGMDEFMAGVAEGPVMSLVLRRKVDVTDDLVGCACCWAGGVNEAAAWAVEVTIDGDG